MNRCHGAPALFVILASGLVGAAWAQVPGPGGGVPRNIKQASSIGPFRDAIHAFIHAEVKRLASKDPPVVAQARESLSNETMVDGKAAAPAYLDAYADMLNKALLPLASDAHMPTRLNAAIVAARVAQVAGNARLADVVAKFVGDEAEPVVLWGAKAAKPILPALLGDALLARNNPLLPALVPAAKRCNNGAVAQDIYDALTPEPRETPQDVLVAVLPHVLDLVEVRVQKYVTGVPEDPLAENRATLFLVDSRVWAAMTAQQQLKAVQVMSDHLSLAAQRATRADRAEREMLSLVISQTAKALWVVGDAVKADSLVKAVTGATKISPATPAGNIERDVQGVYTAIRAVPAFATVKPPPKIQVTTDATTASGSVK